MRERERERQREWEGERERKNENMWSMLSYINQYEISIKTTSTSLTTELPKNVPKKNGISRTPMIGEARLINQFGRKGVILRNMMYHSMSSW